MAKNNREAGDKSIFTILDKGKVSNQPTDPQEEVKDPLERNIPAFYEKGTRVNNLKVFSNDSFEQLRMPRQPHWSVAWSDLMMTMFILFAILYIFQVDQNKELKYERIHGFRVGTNLISDEMVNRQGGFVGHDGGTISEGKQLSNLYEISRQTVQTEKLEDFASVELVADKTVRIILTGDLLFDTGKAEIKTTAFDSLQKIIPLVSQTPYIINVAGHTDDRPINNDLFPSNWELSLIRASRVARYLIEKTGLSPDKFYITGHASYQPLQPNNSPENQAANRRVEIILVRQKPNVTNGSGGIIQ